MSSRLLKVLLFALVLVGLDQFTKSLALDYLSYGRPVTIIPYVFDFKLVFNTGAAFSMFSGLPYGRWLLAGVAAVAVALVVWLAMGTAGKRLTARIALGCIAGGAVGNQIDRLWMGHVVDFIDWHLGPYYWPTFNIADAGITVGAVYIGLLMIRGKA